MRFGFLRQIQKIAPVFILAGIMSACSSTPPSPTTTLSTPGTLESPSPTAQEETAGPTATSPAPAAEPQASPTVVFVPTLAPVSDPDVLYLDDFKTLIGGWPQQEFDNFYIGYHEPEWYHVEIQSPNDDALVTLPGEVFDDFTAEVEVFVESTLTAPEGDFRYGLVYRRSGNLWYAFTISPRTGTWSVLKRTPDRLEVLLEGESETLLGLEGTDTLRVDSRGSTSLFYINGQSIGSINDPDYARGELGFYVETFDDPQVHIHYDRLTIREVQAPMVLAEGVLYIDDFKTLIGGWPQQEFDNFYIGYHEPEWYHVEIQSPNDDALVTLPGEVFDDFTAEVEVFVESTLTAPEGDFRYGLVYRRSGNLWYAFTISPRTGTWSVLKRTPDQLEVLRTGSFESSDVLAGVTTLRVDARGSTYFFMINDLALGALTDPDYARGEVGFYVQTMDNPQVHVHFDALTIREVEAPRLQCQVVTEALYVRTGPGLEFDPPITAVILGEQFEPLGGSTDGLWTAVRLAGSDEPGWVRNDPKFIRCSVPTTDLPLIQP